MFIALEVSIEVVQLLRPVIDRLKKRDRKLAGQLADSSSSAPLNLAEGSQRKGGDQLHHYRIAAGSAREARVTVRVARCAGHLDGLELTRLDALMDRQGALLYRLAPWR
jgi:four helix bundle protein